MKNVIKIDKEILINFIKYIKNIKYLVKSKNYCISDTYELN